jgi:hypothetical protein
MTKNTALCSDEMFQNALAYFATIISYEHNMFVKFTTVINFINFFHALLIPLQNKLAHSLHPSSDEMFQNALTYFTTDISYKHKMLMKFTTIINFINILYALLKALANQQSHLCSNAMFSKCTSMFCYGHKLRV